MWLRDLTLPVSFTTQSTKMPTKRAKMASGGWVKYEIAQSIAHKNGLLGIYIHHLKDPNNPPASRGAKPAVPRAVDFPAYDWDKDLDRFRKEIEAAGKRADALRAAK